MLFVSAVAGGKVTPLRYRNDVALTTLSQRRSPHDYGIRDHEYTPPLPPLPLRPSGGGDEGSQFHYYYFTSHHGKW